MLAHLPLGERLRKALASRLAWPRGLGLDSSLCYGLATKPRDDLIEKPLAYSDEGVPLANAHICGVVLADACGAQRLMQVARANSVVPTDIDEGLVNGPVPST